MVELTWLNSERVTWGASLSVIKEQVVALETLSNSRLKTHFCQMVILWGHFWPYKCSKRKTIAKKLRFFWFPPNLDSAMILSLANYRPIFSSFRYIPRLGEFCQVSKLVCEITKWRWPTSRCLSAQKLGLNLWADKHLEVGHRHFGVSHTNLLTWQNCPKGGIWRKELKIGL